MMNGMSGIDDLNPSPSDTMASRIHWKASASPQLELGLVNRDQDLIALEEWQGPGHLQGTLWCGRHNTFGWQLQRMLWS